MSAYTDPAIREAEARGARRARELVRRFLRREMKADGWNVDGLAALKWMHAWMLSSEARYKRAAGK